MRLRVALLCATAVLGTTIFLLTGAHPTGASGAVPARVFVVDGYYRISGEPVAPDGSIATQVTSGGVSGVAVLPDGSWLLAADDLVWRLGLDGRVRRVAGSGVTGFSGDGGPATAARIRASAVEALPDGGFLIAESENQRIRRVAPDGTIATVAGSGPTGLGAGALAGDGGPATAARLSDPSDVSRTADGGFLIADAGNDRIRRVSPDGTIATVAGGGRPRSGTQLGDGGPALAANLFEPHGVAARPDGGFVIADTRNDRIVGVNPDGVISTVAGTGSPGYSGDRGPATRAKVASPGGVTVADDGTLLIADSDNGRVRSVGTDGRIATVAGSRPYEVGADPLSRNGEQASEAVLDPRDVARTPDGGLAIVGGHVWFMAPPSTPRVAVALYPRRGRASSRGYAVKVLSTVAGRVELTVERPSLSVSGVSRPAAARTPTEVAVDRRLRPAVYRVTVTATTDGGGAATNATELVLGGRLPIGVARRAMVASGFEDVDNYVVRVETCHRFGSRRVDCAVMSKIASEAAKRCDLVAAVHLTTRGLLEARDYNCRTHGRRPFQARPRWTTGRFELELPSR